MWGEVLEALEVVGVLVVFALIVMLAGIFISAVYYITGFVLEWIRLKVLK